MSEQINNAVPIGTEEETLSVPEAGRRFFKLSERSAYAAAERGEIPAVRVGGLWRVPTLAVRAMFIELGKRAAHRNSGSEPLSAA
jgi:hypothetical protein